MFLNDNHPNNKTDVLSLSHLEMPTKYQLWWCIYQVYFLEWGPSKFYKKVMPLQHFFIFFHTLNPYPRVKSFSPNFFYQIVQSLDFGRVSLVLDPSVNTCPTLRTLNIVFSVTNSIYLTQYQSYTTHVVSPTLHVNPTIFIISYQIHWTLQIYNVAMTITY